MVINCKKRTCPGCGPLWAGDTRQKVLSNVHAYAGSVALVTVTAPSLPWDRAHCGHTTEQCSGPKGCRVVPSIAQRWNSDAPARWSRMHRAVSGWVRRRIPGGVSYLAGAWEDQKRGVLHLHLVLGMETGSERAAAHAYVNRLSEVAGEYGFGFVDRGRRERGSSTRSLANVAAGAAANYVAKYIAKGVQGGGLVLSETAKRADAPPRLVHVSQRLTTRTGVTMRNLRLRRRAYARCRDLGFCHERAREIACDTVGIRPAPPAHSRAP